MVDAAGRAPAWVQVRRCLWARRWPRARSCAACACPGARHRHAPDAKYQSRTPLRRFESVRGRQYPHAVRPCRVEERPCQPRGDPSDNLPVTVFHPLDEQGDDALDGFRGGRRQFVPERLDDQPVPVDRTTFSASGTGPRDVGATRPRQPRWRRAAGRRSIAVRSTGGIRRSVLPRSAAREAARGWQLSPPSRSRLSRSAGSGPSRSRPLRSGPAGRPPRPAAPPSRSGPDGRTPPGKASARPGPPRR
jgi:hypothetical protein